MIKKQLRAKSIVVFSPHMDDAVLSLGGFIIRAIKRGVSVKIVTVFSCFGNDEKPPVYSKKYVYSSGYQNISDFERGRNEEDYSAMGDLGVSFENWGYTDAGFRKGRTGWLYPNKKVLLSGKIASQDFELVGAIRKKMSKYKSEKCLVPFGGVFSNHVDHLILREAASVLPDCGYYLEWPYLLDARLSDFVKFCFFLKKNRVKLHWSDRAGKEDILRRYVSQFPLWRYGSKWKIFPEILVSPKND